MACKIVAEIGINHQGSVETAKSLIAHARSAGCDSAKFQVRTPEVCVPRDQWDTPRVPPWGGPPVRYIDYKRAMEFDDEQLEELFSYAWSLDIEPFASCWDVTALDRVAKLRPRYFKIASASLTDLNLIRATRDKALQLSAQMVISTGMSDMKAVTEAHDCAWHPKMMPPIICHSVSTYPCPNEHVNLSAIQSLKALFGPSVGYSGHEVGIQISVAAVALGAVYIERHLTLDRSMPGTDHAASLEPEGMRRLVRDIRVIEVAMGDGVKRWMPGEEAVAKKLRKVG